MLISVDADAESAEICSIYCGRVCVLATFTHAIEYLLNYPCGYLVFDNEVGIDLTLPLYLRYLGK